MNPLWILRQMYAVLWMATGRRCITQGKAFFFFKGKERRDIGWSKIHPGEGK